MKKILFLSPASNLGGAERSLLDLVSHLDRTRFDPYVLLPKRGLLEEKLHQSHIQYKILKLPNIALEVGRSPSIKNILTAILAFFAQIPFWIRLLLFVKKTHFDLIHSNGVKCHLQACLIRLFLRKPIIWHVRDIFTDHYFIHILLFLGKIFQPTIITNSRATAEAFSKHGKNINNIHIIYNGFDFEKIIPKNTKQEIADIYRADSRKTWIGHFGVFVPWKGQEIFLQAAKLCLERSPNLLFFLVGGEIYDTQNKINQPGTFLSRLKKLTCQLGIENSVIFTGFQENILSFMNAMDIIVHSSTRPEPFGRVPVEAMACQKAVVASAEGGILEIIDSDRVGIAIPPRDPAELAKALLKLAADQGLREAMGHAARESSCQKFSIQQHVDKVQRLYERILATEF